jgi:hypothetical protein
MIDVSVLVDKLNSFETAKEVADFLHDQNVQGTPGSAETCVISQWISRESERRVTTSANIKVWEKNAGLGVITEMYKRSEIIASFIHAFDMGAFPELIGTYTDQADY